MTRRRQARGGFSQASGPRSGIATVRSHSGSPSNRSLQPVQGPSPVACMTRIAEPAPLLVSSSKTISRADGSITINQELVLYLAGGMESPAGKELKSLCDPNAPIIVHHGSFSTETFCHVFRGERSIRLILKTHIRSNTSDALDVDESMLFADNEGMDVAPIQFEMTLEESTTPQTTAAVFDLGSPLGVAVKQRVVLQEDDSYRVMEALEFRANSSIGRPKQELSSTTTGAKLSDVKFRERVFAGYNVMRIDRDVTFKFTHTATTLRERKDYTPALPYPQQQQRQSCSRRRSVSSLASARTARSYSSTPSTADMMTARSPMFFTAVSPYSLKSDVESDAKPIDSSTRLARSSGKKWTVNSESDKPITANRQSRRSIKTPKTARNSSVTPSLRTATEMRSETSLALVPRGSQPQLSPATRTAIASTTPTKPRRDSECCSEDDVHTAVASYTVDLREDALAKARSVSLPSLYTATGRSISPMGMRPPDSEYYSARMTTPTRTRRDLRRQDSEQDVRTAVLVTPRPRWASPDETTARSRTSTRSIPRSHPLHSKRDVATALAVTPRSTATSARSNSTDSECRVGDVRQFFATGQRIQLGDTPLTKSPRRSASTSSTRTGRAVTPRRSMEASLYYPIPGETVNQINTPLLMDFVTARERSPVQAPAPWPMSPVPATAVSPDARSSTERKSVIHPDIRTALPTSPIRRPVDGLGLTTPPRSRSRLGLDTPESNVSTARTIRTPFPQSHSARSRASPESNVSTARTLRTPLQQSRCSRSRNSPESNVSTARTLRTPLQKTHLSRSRSYTSPESNVSTALTLRTPLGEPQRADGSFTSASRSFHFSPNRAMSRTRLSSTAVSEGSSVFDGRPLVRQTVDANGNIVVTARLSFQTNARGSIRLRAAISSGLRPVQLKVNGMEIWNQPGGASNVDPSLLQGHQAVGYRL